MYKYAVRAINLVRQNVNLSQLKEENFRQSVGKIAYELRPPMPWELPTAISQATKLIKNRGNIVNLSVKEVTINTLVAVEVGVWFFVGEIIGKGTFIGYQV